MTLPCLPCHTLLRTQSTDIEEAVQLNKPVGSPESKKRDRNWSGCLMPPPHEAKRRACSHRRGNSESAINENSQMTEPQLLRCGGMRRDWSFEELEKRAIVVRM